MEVGNFQEQSKSARQLKVEKNWKERLGFDNDEFRRQTGVNIYAVRNLRSKMAMLLFWSEGDQERRQRIIDFVKEYKETGISALINFLGNEKTYGEEILAIGEKANSQDAKKIFSKVAELAEWVEKISDELAEAFFDPEKIVRGQTEFANLREAKGVALKSIDKVTGRVSEIIKDFYTKINHKEEIDKNNIKTFLENLENSKIQIDILSSLLKTAKENGIRLTLENIKDMRMETHELGDLAGSKKAEFREKYEKEVMDMMRKSYTGIFENNPEAKEKVEENFKERFENLEKYRVYVLMFQGEAAAFSVIDPDSKDCEKGEVMSESTVVHPDVQKGSMGIEFLRRIFEEELKRPEIEAIRGKVRADHPAGGSYDRIGLVADQSRPRFEEKGVEYEWRVKSK